MRAAPGFNSWTQLNAWLAQCTESREVYDLLRLSVISGARQQVVQRLHQRYNKLRYEEEKKVLATGSMPSSIGKYS